MKNCNSRVLHFFHDLQDVANILLTLWELKNFFEFICISEWILWIWSSFGREEEKDSHWLLH